MARHIDCLTLVQIVPAPETQVRQDMIQTSGHRMVQHAIFLHFHLILHTMLILDLKEKVLQSALFCGIGEMYLKKGPLLDHRPVPFCPN